MCKAGDEPVVGCVILNYNDADNVKELISSIRDYETLNCIMVVDNCSTDGSMELIEQLRDDKVLCVQSSGNLGYDGGNNFGMRLLSEEHGCTRILIANPDVRFSEDCLRSLLVEICEDKLCAVVSCEQLLMGEKPVEFSAWNPPRKRSLVLSPCLKKSPYVRIGDSGKRSTVKVDCVAGAMLLADAEVLGNAGYYDEDVFLFSEEMILAKKINRIGYHTLYLPSCSYQHIHSTSVAKTYKKKADRLRTLYRGRRILLKRYYDANPVEIGMFELLCKIRLLRERFNYLGKRTADS
ncbi:MAG: glycosyltransferase family 2 protein [Coriobacteriia bacterium]|nr:glycosyltransferase family 2 protein [Coriobacteriia bacterium]